MLDPALVRFVSAHRSPCSADWTWDNARPLNEDMLIWFVESGFGHLRLDDLRRDLAPGDCIVMPLGLPVRVRHDPRRPFTILWTVFRFADRRRRQLVPDPAVVAAQYPLLRRLPEHALVSPLLYRCWRAQDNPLEAESWLRVTLLEIAWHDRRVGITASGADEQRLALHRCCWAMRQEPAHPWSVAGMARSLGWSNDHFSRRFRVEIGCSPRDFIGVVRIDAARHLLRTSSLPIGRIAEQLGYHDIYHFSRRFRHAVGCSPTVYRQS